MENPYSPNINILMKIARKASRNIIRDFGELEFLQHSKNGPYEFARLSRTKAVKLIIQEISQLKNGTIYANGVETLKSSQSPFVWHIEAIDGIENFARNQPFFAISICLSRINNDILEPIAAIVDFPALRETYYAEKGRGAFVERYFDSSDAKSKLRITNKGNLENLFIYSKNDIDDIATRDYGCDSLGLAYVASSKFDAFIGENIESINHLYAGFLVIKEAGGIVKTMENIEFDFENPNTDFVIASSKNFVDLYLQK